MNFNRKLNYKKMNSEIYIKKYDEFFTNYNTYDIHMMIYMIMRNIY